MDESVALQFQAIKDFHEEREKRNSERFEGQEQAIRIADERLKEYKDHANSLRSTFVNKTEYDLLQLQVNRLELALVENKGRREGMSATWATVITILGILIGAGIVKFLGT